MPPLADLVITGGTVVDGTGAPGVATTLVVREGVVTDLLHPGEAVPEAERRLPADGLVVAPGFIDPHQHSDCSPLVTPWMDSFLRQGVTTAISGNCGLSAWPGSVSSEAIEMTGVHTEDITQTWDDAATFFAALEAAKPAINVASLVGHGSIREAVLGLQMRAPTDDELRAMQHEVEDALAAGALGLSTGLIYVPGIHATTEEVSALAEVMGGTRAVYASHMRNEGMRVFEAIEEATAIGRHAQVPVHISHLKLDVPKMWGKVPELFAAIDRARDIGVDITCDHYPYAAWETTLAAFLPPWAPVASLEELLAMDPERLRVAVETGDGDWQSSVLDVGWERVAIGAHVVADYSGQSIAALAAGLGVSDPFDAFCQILLEDPNCGVVGHTMDEADVAAIRARSDVMVGSDGIATKPDGPLRDFQVHPRYYGTYPRVLGRYVREQQVLSLEDAVAAMTSRVADRFGLEGRGRLAVGSVADIVLFDPGTVLDRATFAEPHTFPEGIEAVAVAGRLAWSRLDGYVERAGRVLRRTD